MRTPGQLLFIEVFAAVVTVVGCALIGWVAYRVLDNLGYAAFFAFCGLGIIACFWYGIRTDLREGRYELHELPGALFRRQAPTDRD